MVVLGYILLAMVSLYAVAGLAVGLRFATVLAAQSDERAAVGTFFFRLLLIPGAALLWPLVVRLGSAGFPKILPHPCQDPAVPETSVPGSQA
jgi:hypothetical protein